MENSEERQKLKETFKNQLLKHVDLFNAAVSTGEGDWVVKGFIDIAKNIYTISADTKVVSKIMELLLFPKICQFTQETGYKIVLCKEQNYEPEVVENFFVLNSSWFGPYVRTYLSNSKQLAIH